MEAKAKKRPGNLGDLVYQRLRTDILTGRLAAGTQLSMAEIANLNGTSLGPVREALKRLQQDQLVVGKANQQFTVARFDISDLDSTFCLNLAVNALAIRISVPFLNDEEVQTLKRMADLMESELEREGADWDATYPEFMVTYHEFIAEIIKHAGERIVALSNQLMQDILRYSTSRTSEPHLWRAARPAFGLIANAASARDGRLASRHFAESIARLSSLALTSASPGYDAFRLRGVITTLLPEQSHNSK